MLYQIRESDIIVVWKLDRLARSMRDLLATIETIREAGGRFLSLSEPWADRTNHAGKMDITIFAGIAEFERGLIRERTSAGRRAAKKRGVQFRRPKKLTLDQGALARRLVAEGRPVRAIASVFNVHPAITHRFSDFVAPRIERDQSRAMPKNRGERGGKELVRKAFPTTATLRPIGDMAIPILTYIRINGILLHSATYERGSLRVHDRRFSEAMTDKQLVLDTTGQEACATYPSFLARDGVEKLFSLWPKRFVEKGPRLYAVEPTH